VSYVYLLQPSRSASLPLCTVAVDKERISKEDVTCFVELRRWPPVVQAAS
jgi:hypothetical protein